MAELTDGETSPPARKAAVNTPDPLEGAKLKIERANSHIPEVNTLLDFLLAPESREVTSEIDPAKGEIRHKIRLIKQPPVMVGVACGEILYGLRSALDHLVTATATKRGIVIIEKTGFPIEETREKFEVALRNRKIAERFPALAAVLKELKPYKGGGYDGFLWWLHWLNGVEKHKIIVPMVGTHVGFKFDLVLKALPGFDASRDLVLKAPKTWNYLDKEPITVFVHPLHTEIQGEMDLDFNVTFRDVDTPHPWGMVDTLQKFVDLTRAIVAIFEERFFK
jgi:hypothetical protein